MSRFMKLARVLDVVRLSLPPGLNDDNVNEKGGILKQTETPSSSVKKQVKFQDEEEASTLGTDPTSEEDTPNPTSKPKSRKEKRKSRQPDPAAQHLAIRALPPIFRAILQTNRRTVG